MKEARRTKRKKKERLGNRLALVGITFVVLSMAVVVNMRSASLKQRDLEYQMKEESLRNQLAQEEQRAAKLEEERQSDVAGFGSYDALAKAIQEAQALEQLPQAKAPPPQEGGEGA